MKLVLVGLYCGPISDKLASASLSTSEEKVLYDAVVNLPELSVSSLAAIEASITALAGLAEPINHFFDNVVVNSEDEDIRLNRLALLSRIRGAMYEIADFGQLEGP